jgi:XTP/dITP diphosphohydrolase
MSSAATGQLVLATRNQKKLTELHRILAPRLAVRVLGLDDVPPFPELPETGASFADNALIKAREAARRWAGRAAVAPDGGKLPDADRANLQLLLDQLQDTPDERLTARFVCAAALVTPDGQEIVREAEMPGRLVRTPRGDNGFGYDPIFVPEGYDRTSAELPSETKDQISHRGRALRALLPDLVAVLGSPGAEPVRCAGDEPAGT